MILRLLCPRDHHKWVTLQEGREADEHGRYPNVDRLPGFDVKWLLKPYTDSDCAIFMGNMGSRTTVTEDTVSAGGHIPLSNAHKQKQPGRDVEVHTGEGSFEGQVSPNRVGSERSQGLMGAEEDFVATFAEKRQ